MSVAQIAEWRLPGCGENCIPRRHDPIDHERYGHESGYTRAVKDMRPRVVSVGCLTVDLLSKIVTVDNEQVPITPTEYSVLEYLSVNVGRRCSAEEITQAIWGDIREQWVGHNVSVHMSRLRSKLGPAASLIHTKAGFGYMLRHSQRDVLSLPVRGAQ